MSLTPQADFVLLMLHGYADRLAGRGQPLAGSAEVALAVLTYCASHESASAKRREDVALFGRVQQRLTNSFGQHVNWDRVRGRVMGQLRSWRGEQCRDRPAGVPEPGFDELLREAERLVREECPEMTREA